MVIWLGVGLRVMFVAVIGVRGLKIPPEFFCVCVPSLLWASLSTLPQKESAYLAALSAIIYSFILEIIALL